MCTLHGWEIKEEKMRTEETVSEIFRGGERLENVCHLYLDDKGLSGEFKNYLSVKIGSFDEINKGVKRWC